MAADKQTKLLAKQLFKLSLVIGVVSPEQVAGVLGWIEKTSPSRPVALLKAYHHRIALELAKSRAEVEHAGPVTDATLKQIEAAMTKKYGNVYVKDVIPQRMYKGMDKDNPQATVTNLLAVHANMDDKTAYTILKTLWEHRVDLVRVHAEAVNLKPENQKAEASSIPWHPAAIKYFAEQGIKIK